MYTCAQNACTQNKSQKSADASKQRDKLRMRSFDCKGWLVMLVAEGSDEITVKLSHKEAHVPYCSVGIPDDVKRFVDANAQLSMTAVSSCPFGTYPAPQLTYCSMNYSYGMVY
jgi:hypothetical protein